MAICVSSGGDCAAGGEAPRPEAVAQPTAADSSGQLNSMSPSIPISLGGEDYLTLSLYLRHRSFEETAELFDHHRQAAEARRNGEDELCLGDQQFLMLPLGAKVGKTYFRWQLQSSTGFILQFMNRSSCEGTMPNAKLIATSMVLMRLGVEEVVRQACAALEALDAYIVQNKVSRVDLCCDLPDRRIEPLKAAFDAEHCVMRAGQSDEYGAIDNYITTDYSFFRIHKEVTSFNVGYGDVRMRAYEKLRECQFDYEKLQALIKYRWGVCPCSAIRIEFQLRREKLTKLGVDNFVDWMAKRSSIAHYLTHDWFRLTDGPYDPKHPERAKILPEWREVQAAFASWTGGGPLLDLGPIPKQPVPANHYLRSIIGLLVSYFAKSGTHIDSNEAFMHEGWCPLLDEIENRNMAEEVRRRALELGLSDLKGESC